MVFNSNDLESLLDSYLFVAGNEALGQHENVAGSVKLGISGHSFPDKNIVDTYYGFKKTLFHKIDDVLAESSGEVQRDFFERVLPQREKVLESDFQASQNNLIRYKDKELEENTISQYMEFEHLSKDEALCQYVYDVNYNGREGIKATGYLIENLGKNLNNTQTNAGAHK